MKSTNQTLTPQQVARLLEDRILIAFRGEGFTYSECSAERRAIQGAANNAAQVLAGLVINDG